MRPALMFVLVAVALAACGGSGDSDSPASTTGQANTPPDASPAQEKIGKEMLDETTLITRLCTKVVQARAAEEQVTPLVSSLIREYKQLDPRTKLFPEQAHSATPQSLLKATIQGLNILHCSQEDVARLRVALLAG